MTDAQRKFLHDFLGRDYMLFTAQDKHDLLEAVIEELEWDNFINTAYQEYSSQFPFADGEKICMSSLESRFHHYYKWLILLSPEETAELICKWKGVE